MGKQTRWETLAEIIGNRWCIQPKITLKALRELHINNPTTAYQMAVSIGMDKFTEICLEIIEDN